MPLRSFKKGARIDVRVANELWARLGEVSRERGLAVVLGGLLSLTNLYIGLKAGSLLYEMKGTDPGVLAASAVALAAVALATIPFVYIAGVKMRNQTFPLSWIVQSRMADLATIVDENVNATVAGAASVNS